MTDTARNAHRHRRARDRVSAGKDLARADPTASDRGVADEERLQARGRPSVSIQRRLGRSSIARSWRSSRTGRCPTAGFGHGPRKRRHLDAHRHRGGHAPAHGAVRFPAGSATGLFRGRQIWLAALHRHLDNCWRGSTDATARKEAISCELLDQAGASLAVDRLHGDGASPISSPWRSGTPPPWIVYSPLPALPAAVQRASTCSSLPYTRRAGRAAS
jgi:nitroreductase